ncbi:hypothetical protein ACFOSX_00905 [Winogradskyella maritima]|uniref:Uncharacterized protein n=1 Tax=Winogradskyella maritima TaxID=1517766 RepID=A0ABV8AFZ6_9FLAO
MKNKRSWEIVTCLVWMTFGIVAGIDYYSRESYGIVIVMAIITLVYTVRLIMLIMAIK